jgi:hypothetical protein
MRLFLFALLLALPLAACQSDQAEAIEDQGDAIDEAYDDRGDAIEDAMDERADQVDERIEDGAPAGDREDVIGDGEIIDEPGEPDAGTLGQ